MRLWPNGACGCPCCFGGITNTNTSPRACMWSPSSRMNDRAGLGMNRINNQQEKPEFHQVNRSIPHDIDRAKLRPNLQYDAVKAVLLQSEAIQAKMMSTNIYYLYINQTLHVLAMSLIVCSCQASFLKSLLKCSTLHPSNSTRGSMRVRGLLNEPRTRFTHPESTSWRPAACWLG